MPACTLHLSSSSSKLGPALANIFLCYHETTWLKSCPKSFKPVYYKRYVDGIFVLFEKLEQVLQFVNNMNKRHKNIFFFLKLKKIIPFLFSMLRFAEKKINLQQVFSEKICSVVYTLILVVLWHLKTNLAKCTHFYISFTIVSDFSKFHFEVETFKKTLHKNAYPTEFAWQMYCKSC